jgi:hypothetical protein
MYGSPRLTKQDGRVGCGQSALKARPRTLSCASYVGQHADFEEIYRNGHCEIQRSPRQKRHPPCSGSECRLLTIVTVTRLLAGHLVANSFFAFDRGAAIQLKIRIVVGPFFWLRLAAACTSSSGVIDIVGGDLTRLEELSSNLGDGRDQAAAI